MGTVGLLASFGVFRFISWSLAWPVLLIGLGVALLMRGGAPMTAPTTLPTPHRSAPGVAFPLGTAATGTGRLAAERPTA